MSDTWGKGSVNNNIGWGQAAGSATNNWGESQKTSWAGQTDIVGITSVSIAYSSSAFCADASDPTPTISNNAGVGTFSSTSGLVFISTTTGEVDLDASTAGATYVITYTDTDSATATFSLTINDLDNSGFSYSASSYEPTDADPTPTITGLTGGTFSGTTGLVINSATGEIDLSASTEATHTVTYSTFSSGSSVCPNTSTQTVEIAVAVIANNYSISFDGVDDYITTNSIFSALDGLQKMTLSVWIKPTNLNFRHIITIASGTGNSNNLIRLATRDTGALWWNVGTSSYNALETTPALTLNQWNHIGLVFDSTQVTTTDRVKIYVNNTLSPQTGNMPLNKTIGTATGGIFIGENAGSLSYLNSFAGEIDELGIWNTDLSSTQVSEIYNATSTNLTKDLSTVAGGPVYWNRMGDN